MSGNRLQGQRHGGARASRNVSKIRKFLLAGAGGVSALGAGVALVAPSALAAVNAASPLSITLATVEFPLTPDTTDSADPWWLDGNSLIGGAADASPTPNALASAIGVGGSCGLVCNGADGTALDLSLIHI